MQEEIPLKEKANTIETPRFLKQMKTKQYTFFIRTFLLEHEVRFCSKFKNKLRGMPASTTKNNIKNNQKE